MIVVQCEKCLSSFKLDPTKIPASGTKGKCGKCGHIFSVQPPSNEFTDKEVTDLHSAIISAAQMAQGVYGQDEKKSDPLPAFTVPPASPAFKVSPEAMQRYQSRVNQSFKKQTTGAPPRVPEVENRFTAKENQTYARGIIVICLIITFAAFCIKTRSIHPTHILTGIRYGVSITGGKLNLVESRVSLLHSSNLQDTLRISGTLFNATDKPTLKEELDIELYDINGTTVFSKKTNCCDRLIQPTRTMPFLLLTSPLENKTIVNYKISVN